MANILDGKALSLKIKEELKEKVASFKNKYDRSVKLAVVMIGDDPASSVYVKNKIRACEFIGINSLSYTLPKDVEESEAEELIKSLASDKSIDGILVQLPLPKGLNETKIFGLIPPEKDVDGFSDVNIGKLTQGKACTVACTPKGILTMLKSSGIVLSGKHAVVLGRSNIVGKPISLLLLKENCTVTICHSKTEKLKEICKEADILVAAIGKREFVTADMVKDGAVVVDVGINRTESGLRGDVAFDEVSKKASYISPVPGGVGPMTIAMLMENVYECAVRREENELRNGI